MALSVYVASCGSDGGGIDANAGSASIREIRGDTIVVHARDPRHARGGTLIEDVTIGVVDGLPQYEFGDVTDAALAASGGVYVLDGQAQIVREFGPTGDFVRDVATRGEGPGEISRASTMVVAPDGTLYVGETQVGVVHQFSRAGEYQRSVSLGRRIDERIVVDTAGILYVRLPAPQSTSYKSGSDLQAIDSMPQSIEVRRGSTVTTTQLTFRFTRDGVLVDSIPPIEQPDLDSYLEYMANGRIYIAMDYVPWAWWSWSPFGYRISGRTDFYALDLHFGSGEPLVTDSVISIRREIAPVPIEPGERRALTAQIGLVEGMLERQPGRWNGPTQAPETKPAYHRALIAQDGRVWVWMHTESEPVPEADANRWREIGTAFDVYGPLGEYLGHVTGPPGVRPANMRGDTLLSFSEHELGVDQVTRWLVRWVDR